MKVASHYLSTVFCVLSTTAFSDDNHNFHCKIERVDHCNEKACYSYKENKTIIIRAEKDPILNQPFGVHKQCDKGFKNCYVEELYGFNRNGIYARYNFGEKGTAGYLNIQVHLFAHQTPNEFPFNEVYISGSGSKLTWGHCWQ